MDLLVELSSKYKLPKENISYFVTFLNSSFYTIKNKTGCKTEKGGYEISKSKLKKNILEDKLIDSLYLSNVYLDNISLLNLVQINKDFYTKYKKKILSNILKRDEKLNKITNVNRINIWKNLLKIVNKKILFINRKI